VNVVAFHATILEPFSMVIFGATGDLAKRKLFPALFSLFQRGLLSSPFIVVGVGRTAGTSAQFRSEIRQSIEVFSRRKVRDEEEWERFVAHFHYRIGDVNQLADYEEIKQTIETYEQGWGRVGSGNRLFYLAVAPDLFAPAAFHLNESGLAFTSGWKRLVLEKPIGHDYRSARELNEQVRRWFGEQEIYRIDHYLGKEMVQNIEVIRFANALFEPLWNHHYIASVQITASETVGVEERAGYYDKAGALRDMVQNHMLQMLMMVSMEPPSRLKPEAIHDEKVKVLQSLRRYEQAQVGEYVVRGQYIAGKSDQQRVPAYRAEPNVNPASQTETFVAAACFVDNLRWSGVPFYLRTGKRMEEKATEIVIQFKGMPKNLYFNKNNDLEPNLLVISIHPHEGIHMIINAKQPGRESEITPISMEFCNNCLSESAEAYESLLYAAIAGDQTFFTHWDEVSLAWEWIDPIRQAWDEERAPLYFYESGLWGPQAAHDLLAKAGHHWWPVTGMRSHHVVKANPVGSIL
jgi:glucose-6-phosphate 1-dehydrogenase